LAEFLTVSWPIGKTVFPLPRKPKAYSDVPYTLTVSFNGEEAFVAVDAYGIMGITWKSGNNVEIKVWTFRLTLGRMTAMGAKCSIAVQ
jgi:hypothetical protein